MTFKKALDDFCATLGFHFIDERVPKKWPFFLILGIQVTIELQVTMNFFLKSSNIHFYRKYDAKLYIYV